MELEILSTIVYKQATSNEELSQILELQAKNLPDALSQKEKIEQGFVTVRHELQLLQEMNERFPHTIATQDGKVIGYALSMHPDFGSEIAVLKPMFAEINFRLAQRPELENYIVMGQVCIDKDYRKQGIFRNLYLQMKAYAIPPFSCIITEVDANNIRSMEAHKAIGFKTLSTYHALDRQWELIYLN